MGNCLSRNGSNKLTQKHVRNVSNLLLYGYVRECCEEYNIHLSVTIKDTIVRFYQSFGVIYGIGKNFSSMFGIGCTKPLTKFLKLQQMSYLFEGNVDNVHCNNDRIYIKTGHNALYVSGSKTEVLEYNPYFTKYQPSIKCISRGIKGSLHSIFVSNEDELYAYGKNVHGAFGDGKIETYTMDKPWIPHLLKLDIDVFSVFGSIRQIVCGLKHTMFLTAAGKVFNCGSNDRAALGYEDGTDNDKLIPTFVDAFAEMNITQIACGKHHNLCIDEHKRLYVFGNNTSNQLGVMNEREIYGAKLQPFFDENKINIDKVDCGECHTLCLNSNNVCYGFGRNMFYEIGTGDQNKVYVPKEIVFYNDKDGDVNSSLLQKHINVENMSCGQYHNVLLSTDNSVITFGGNDFKQCSVNIKHDGFVKTPYELDRVKDIGIQETDVIIGVIAVIEETMIIVKG